MGMSMARGGSQLPQEGGKVVPELGIAPPFGGCRTPNLCLIWKGEYVLETGGQFLQYETNIIAV